MANNDVTIEGIDENLKRLASQNKRVTNKALKKGAEYVRKTLEQNTPTGKSGIHLKDNTVVTNMDQNGEIKIGFNGKGANDVSWRVHFVELGTMKQPPQAFIQRTQAQTKERFFSIVAEELKKGLGL